LVNFGP